MEAIQLRAVDLDTMRVEVWHQGSCLMGAIGESDQLFQVHGRNPTIDLLKRWFLARDEKFLDSQENCQSFVGLTQHFSLRHYKLPAFGIALPGHDRVSVRDWVLGLVKNLEE